MRRRIVLSYVAVAALILLALEVPLGIVYARHERDIAYADLNRDAAALASLVEEGVERRADINLVAVADNYRSEGHADVEIVGRDGAVLVPPRADGDDLSNPAVGAHISTVLSGGLGGVHTLPGSDEAFAVVPVGPADHPAGAVALTAPDARVDSRVHAAWLALAALAGVTLAAVAGLGLLIARSVTGPLTHLERAAERLGEGELRARAPADEGPEEVRALSRAFNEMAGRLEDLVSAQRSFVADASHQLRSPLTALRLRLENMTAALPSAEGASEFDAVLAEVERLSRLVDGLLVLARSEGQRPERRAVDVSAVVADRCAAWSALAEEAGITLESDPGKGLVALMVPGHLEQIIDNLLANATEATPAGRSVRVSAARAGSSVEVHVVDEGRGMGEEERQHAFDRFWRGSGSRPGSGSGLGLAIVRQLARTSGADVELRRADSGGVDAVVRAPVLRSAAA